RKGRAPQKLIEKKFSADVKEQVRRALISESYEAAIEQNSLQVLGEPEFDNPDAVKIEEDAPLNYSFTVEIQPDITLPELKGFKVKSPKSPSPTSTSIRPCKTSASSRARSRPSRTAASRSATRSSAICM